MENFTADAAQKPWTSCSHSCGLFHQAV